MNATPRILAGIGLAWLLSTANAAPTIVFKLDDLSDAAYARTGFAQVFRVLEAKDVCGSFGVITRSCVDDGTKAEYYAMIQRWAQSGRVEIWHHGWDHRRGEFRGTDLSSQRTFLGDGLALLKAKCGVAMTAFGAPFGETDGITGEALNATPEIVAWFASPDDVGATATPLRERAPMEVKTGVVSYESFVAAFERKKEARYLVVLGHPPYWDAASHAAFERVVDFCRQQGCTFATPTEMAALLKNDPDLPPSTARSRTRGSRGERILPSGGLWHCAEISHPGRHAGTFLPAGFFRTRLNSDVTEIW